MRDFLVIIGHKLVAQATAMADGILDRGAEK